MDRRPHDDLTILIQASREGDRDAQDQLFQQIYDELRALARRLPFVDPGGTMQPTALANEAYLLFERKFPVPPRDEPESRATFFRAVARAMRTILRDHWRRKQAVKRGGGDAKPVALRDDDDDAGSAVELDRLDFLSLDEALDELEAYNRRWCDVVMHRYFAGRSIEETAELMGLGLTTVKNDWQLARAWLRRRLLGEGA